MSEVTETLPEDITPEVTETKVPKGIWRRFRIQKTAKPETDNSPPQSPLRRKLIKTTVGAGAALLLADKLKIGFESWTTEASKVPETQLNFQLLKDQIFDVSSDEAQEIIDSEVSKDVQGQREFSDDVNEGFKTLYDGIDRIGRLRNNATFHPENVQKITETLLQYNKDFPTQTFEGYNKKWNADSLKDNYDMVLKLEAFFALRNLSTRGLVSVEQLEAFKFNNTVFYAPSGSANKVDEQFFLGKESRHVRNIKDIPFAGVEQEENSVPKTEKLVQDNWPAIKKASQAFDIDPYYIASLISMEARDKKTYYIYNEEHSFRNIPLTDQMDRAVFNNDGLTSKALQILYFIQKHNDIARYVVPKTVSEDVTDLAAAVLNKNSSVGLGQVNIDTAKRFGALKVGDRVVDADAPNALVGLLLNNPELNIMAIAAYTRNLINEYTRMQQEGLNLFLPDLNKNNPSTQSTQNPLKGDPVYGTNFGVAMFGACYTNKDYPEYRVDNPKDVTQRKLRFIDDINGWGSWVGAYYDHYQENKDRLAII